MWPHVIKSTYGVDASAAMTNLATNILYAGDSVENAPALSGVTFRRTLTGSRLRQCDLVTSAFSLMDQWSKKDRINTLASLWRKTLDYLVIVEPGSKFGYGLIMEAREFFADRGRSSVLKNNLGDTFDDGTPEIFAPVCTAHVAILAGYLLRMLSFLDSALTPSHVRKCRMVCSVEQCAIFRHLSNRSASSEKCTIERRRVSFPISSCESGALSTLTRPIRIPVTLHYGALESLVRFCRRVRVASVDCAAWTGNCDSSHRRKAAMI